MGGRELAWVYKPLERVCGTQEHGAQGGRQVGVEGELCRGPGSPCGRQGLGGGHRLEPGQDKQGGGRGRGRGQHERRGEGGGGRY